MNNKPNMPESNDLENDASYWLAKFDKENLIGFDNIDIDYLARRDANFEQWVNKSLNHRVVFLQLIYVWQHKALENIVIPKTEPTGIVVRKTWFAIAASALLLAVPVFNALKVEDTYVYQTMVGKHKKISLQDGSKIELNSNSEITALVNDNERSVTLSKGEAFFDISPDENKPFRVLTGEQIITVLGTKFSVHKTLKGIEVLVSEGRVKVDVLMSSANSEVVILNAGDVANTQNNKIIVSKQSKEKLAQELSWRKGFIYFDSVTLEQAVAEFNRYNKVKIVFKDRETSQLIVSGQFKSNNYNAFLNFLSEGYDLKVNRAVDLKTIEIATVL